MVKNILKIEGLAVPMISSLDDNSFRFKLYPGNTTHNVNLDVIGTTDDWRMVARLDGRNPEERIVFSQPVSAKYPKVTVYLSITSYKYHRPTSIPGELRLLGRLLSNAPDESISLNEYIHQLNKQITEAAE